MGAPILAHKRCLAARASVGGSTGIDHVPRDPEVPPVHRVPGHHTWRGKVSSALSSIGWLHRWLGRPLSLRSFLSLISFLLLVVRSTSGVWPSRPGYHFCDCFQVPTLGLRHPLDRPHEHRWSSVRLDDHVLARPIVDAHPNALEPSRLQVRLLAIPSAYPQRLRPHQLSELDDRLLARPPVDSLPGRHSISANAQMGDEPACVFAHPIKHRVDLLKFHL